MSPSVPFRPPDIPAFAPRDSYARLAFPGAPSTDLKLRWLAAVTRTFHLRKELAEVKMSSVTSRYVYVSRRREDIIERIKTGEFLSLSLVSQDSPDRPRKFPSYILTRYPVGVDPARATEYSGVYSARRFVQDGSPINRIVIVWSLPDPPPPIMSFDFLPCLPPCEVRRLHNDQPLCYRCWGFGHISRYCSASPKCAWCAASHDSKTCPVRGGLARTEASSSTSESSSAGDASHWQCPRCLKPGVTVWHGCARRRSPSAPAAATPPPPPPSSGSMLPIGPASSPDLVLRKSVASLLDRVKALGDRFTALETKFDKLVASTTAIDTRFSDIVCAQQAIISAVTVLTDKMDGMGSRFESLSDAISSTNQSSSTGRLPALTSRSPTSRRRVRH